MEGNSFIEIYNSHTTQLSHLKYATQWLLVHSESCVANTISNFRTFCHSSIHLILNKGRIQGPGRFNNFPVSKNSTKPSQAMSRNSKIRRDLPEPHIIAHSQRSAPGLGIRSWLVSSSIPSSLPTRDPVPNSTAGP